jgi:YD repeat-containing protein
LTYDRQGRLITAVYGTSAAIHYQYDSSGNRTRRIFVSSDNPTADHNGNGLYDLWELIHFGHLNADPDADPDNDDLTNREESPHGTDPNNPDTDGDGMPDGWEVAKELDPLVGNADDDTDEDGMTNREEYIADTDPKVRASHLGITAIEIVPDGILLRWQGGAAARQYLEYSPSLGAELPPWTAIKTNQPPTRTTDSVVHETPTPSGFYRIRAERP